MTAEEFIQRAKNVQLENETNMTEQQRKLYDIIDKIQKEKVENDTNLEYNINDLERSDAQEGDLINDFYKALTKNNGNNITIR